MAAVDQVVVAEIEKFRKDVMMADVGLQKVLSWGLKVITGLRNAS